MHSHCRHSQTGNGPRRPALGALKGNFNPIPTPTNGNTGKRALSSAHLHLFFCKVPSALGSQQTARSSLSPFLVINTASGFHTHSGKSPYCSKARKGGFQKEQGNKVKR